MRKRIDGTLEEVMGGIFELYVNTKTETPRDLNWSTRRFLRNLDLFSPTEIFHLMEMLQVAKNEKQTCK